MKIINSVIYSSFISAIACSAFAMSKAPETTASVQQTPSNQSECVALYEDSNFKGKVYWLCLGGANTTKHFTTGFNNDSISSIKIPGEMAVKACEHSNGSGRCQTYFDSVSFVGSKLNDKFSRISLIPFDFQDFYMVVQSDPQYPWTCHSTSDGDCSNTTVADHNNQLQVDAANQILNDYGLEHLGGTIINGDLTAYGHDWQLEAFNDFYVNKMDLNLYLGLGNHDYANNLESCTLKNSCITRMMDYFIDEVQGAIRPTRFDYTRGDSYYKFPSYRRDTEGSFGYSWDIGPIHFVQLNNYPTYEASWDIWNWGEALRDHYKVESALNWLKSDLTAAKNRGQKIILNYHDPVQHWDEKNSEFLSILKDYEVSAIFAGHFHSRNGEYMDYDNIHNGTADIPVILAGGSDYNTFLLVRFNGNQLEVQRVNSEYGKDYQLTPLKTYTLY